MTQLVKVEALRAAARLAPTTPFAVFKVTEIPLLFLHGTKGQAAGSFSQSLCRPVLESFGLIVWWQGKFKDVQSHSMFHAYNETKPEWVKCPFSCVKTFINSAKEKFAVHKRAEKSLELS